MKIVIKILLVLTVLILIFLLNYIISLNQYKQDMASAISKIESYKTEIFESPYGDIQYFRSGKGIPLLVSHGINGGFDQALGMSELYIGTKYEIIAVSRFGYLKTSLPEDSSPEAQANAYALLMDHLGLEKIYVFGNSAGGTSAIQFALKNPDRCKGLILLSSNVPAEVSLPPKPLMKMIFSSNYLYWQVVSLFNRNMLSMFISTEMIEELSHKKIEEITNTILKSGLPVKERTAGYLNDMYLSNPHINKGYPFADIKTPTLIFHAVDDPAPPYEGAKKIADEIPGAKLVTFTTGGHLLMGHEDRVKQEIENFIEALEEAPKSE